MSTAPSMIWQAMGNPAPKWPLESASGNCATCGQAVTRGVSRKQIESETYSQHSDYMQYGDSNCPACAWLHSYPKPNHRSVMVVGSKIWWPVLGMDSITTERPHWADVIKALKGMPDDTPVCGCITTDPKPRLWPRYRMATKGRLGLYVHAPAYDQSGFVEFSLDHLSLCGEIVAEAIEQGFGKRTIYLGLPKDFKRFQNDISRSWRLERGLQLWRRKPEFVVALLVTPAKTKTEVD